MSDPRSCELPRFTRAMLESLGADAAVVDDVLGDMAEEYALRVHSAGRLSPRLWLYREAARTAPHLFRDWMRRFGPRDLRALALACVGGVVAGAAGMMLLALILASLTQLIAGISLSAYMNHWVSTGDMFPAVFVALALRSVVPPVIAGFVAGLLGKRAPLVHAFIAGVVFLAPSTIVALASASAFAAVKTAVILSSFTGIGLVLVGGILACMRVHRGARHAMPL